MATVEAVADAQDTQTGYPHVVQRPGVLGGRPRVEGTRIPVWQIANRWNAGEHETEILAAYPRVTPAALHSALAYYFDHRGEIDAEIEANRPENALSALRNDPDPVEVRPGVFQGRAPFGSARR